MLDYKDLDSGVRNQLERIATRLEEREKHLIDVQWETHGMFRTYDQVPKSDLKRSALRNVRRATAALRGKVDRLDPDPDTETEYKVGRRRAHQGVPAEDLVECYREAIARIVDAFIAEAEAIGLTMEATLAGMRLLWAVSDVVPNAYLAGHRDVAIDGIRSEEIRRASFVIGLLTDSDNAATDKLAFGMSHTGQYWLVRVPLTASRALDVERELRALGGAGLEPLTAHFEGDLVAIVAQRPSIGVLPSLSGGIAAIDGPHSPAELQSSYVTTGSVLSCAEQFGITGLVGHADMSTLLAVATRIDIGALVSSRWLSPVTRTRTGEEVLSTIAEFLSRRCSVAETAKSLGVHQNSVRYRLARYSELTGADLADTDTLVEVWWAFKFRELRSSNSSQENPIAMTGVANVRAIDRR